jgi:hypothetical protein
MAAECYIYDVASVEAAKGTDATAWDWNSDTFKCRWLRDDGSYDPTYVQTHATWAAIVAHADNLECSDTGYPAGGVSLTNPNWGTSGGRGVWKADKVTFSITGTTQSVGAIVIMNNTRSKPVCFIPCASHQLNNKTIEVWFNDTETGGTIFVYGDT